MVDKDTSTCDCILNCSQDISVLTDTNETPKSVPAGLALCAGVGETITLICVYKRQDCLVDAIRNCHKIKLAFQLHATVVQFRNMTIRIQQVFNTTNTTS